MKQKRRWIWLCISLVFFLSFGMEALAQEQGFGVGLVVGEPTGLTGKMWLSREDALVGATAWSYDTPYDKSYNKNAVHYLHVDYIRHLRGKLKVQSGKMPLYFGAGVRMVSINNNDTILGVRVPLGIVYIPESLPIDFFLEVVPIMNLVPETRLESDIAVGVRFFP
jgi:hypothetical protein